MPIQPGSKVGRYQIKTIIGKGGMSVVYKAFYTRSISHLPELVLKVR